MRLGYRIKHEFTLALRIIYLKINGKKMITRFLSSNGNGRKALYVLTYSTRSKYFLPYKAAKFGTLICSISATYIMTGYNDIIL